MKEGDMENQAAVVKAQKSSTIRLTGAANEETLVTAYAIKGGWRVEAVRVTIGPDTTAKGHPRRHNTRGGTSEHATMLEAVQQAKKVADAFVKAGWTIPAKKPFGFARKPDAFDLKSVPKPAKK
jgi:hypothetical protein